MKLELFGEAFLNTRWKRVLFSVSVRGVLSVLFGLFLHVLYKDASGASEIFYYQFMYGIIYILWLLWSVVVLVCLLCRKRTLAVNVIGVSVCVLVTAFTGAAMLINSSREIQPEKSKSNAIAQAVVTSIGDYAPVNLEFNPFECTSLFGMHIEKGEASLTEGEDTVLFVSVEYVEEAPSLVGNAFLQKEQESVNRYSHSIKVKDQIMHPKGEWVAGSSENGTEYLYLYTPLVNSFNLLVKNTGQNQACSIYLDLPPTAPEIEVQAVVHAAIEQIEKLAT